MRVAFVTFGCRLNRAESLDLEARVRAAGHTVVSVSDDVPDVVFVRGCSVTAKAQRDSEKAIAHLKERFPAARIIPLGCLSNARDGEKALMELPAQNPVPMESSRAYLKVQDGCNARCAFCIVPQFRGPSVSEPFNGLIDRAKAFLDAGYREIVVTGCNLALYHSNGRTLADVVAALAELDSAARVRLGSLEPGKALDDLIDAMATHPNVCRFLHLSLQSASSDVLRAMNRPYDADYAAGIVAHAVRALGPRLRLGADLIAGFPGETDDDHERTLRFIASDTGGVISNLHVFPYSERPGTPAQHATFNAQHFSVPVAVRRARAYELEEAGRINRDRAAEKLIGQTVEVCVEKSLNEGLTAENFRCRLSSSYPRRALVPVQVMTWNPRSAILESS